MALARTLKTTWIYYAIGWAVFVPLPLYAVSDYVIDPEFWAPHHACDTIAIPVMSAIYSMIIWGPIAGYVLYLLVWLAAKDRVRGQHLLAGLTSHRPIPIVINLIAGFLIFAVAEDIVWHVRAMMVPQPFEADCDGRAHMITGTVQLSFSVMPIVYSVFIWLALHLRALAVSPKSERDRSTG